MLSRLGLSTLQKTTAAIWMLAYALPANAINEYIKIGESTAVENFKRFCYNIVEVFAEWFLRAPTSHDVARLLDIKKVKVF